MSDSFWAPLRCFVIIFSSYKKSHCAMHMPIPENAIRLQLITYLSSALTPVFFGSNTIDRSIQWLSQHLGHLKKSAGLSLILCTKVLREAGVWQNQNRSYAPRCGSKHPSDFKGKSLTRSFPCSRALTGKKLVCSESEYSTQQWNNF